MLLPQHTAPLPLRNCGMAWVGRALKLILFQPPWHRQRHLPLEQLAPSPVQPGCEHFQGWFQGAHQGQVQGSADLQPVPLLQPQIKPFLCLFGLSSPNYPCVPGLLHSGSSSHSLSCGYSKKNECLCSNIECFLIPGAGSKGKTMHHPAVLFIPPVDSQGILPPPPPPP